MSGGRGHLAHCSASSSGELKRPRQLVVAGGPCLCDAPLRVLNPFLYAGPPPAPAAGAFLLAEAALLTKTGLEVGLATAVPAVFF
jgi:hypothetical protein